MDSLTDPLKELVRLSKLATPGPWTKIGSAKRTLFTTAQGQQQVAPDKAFLPVEIVTCLRHAEQAHADCDFIKAASNAIPSLEALLSRHEKLVEACKRLEDDDDMQAAYDDMIIVLRDIEGGPTA